jgi:intracellular sulfur oxidation DsrE/DsrF family protein
MNSSETFSDEILHAYIDGELDGDTQQCIRTAMQQDSLLRERVTRLHRTKEMMRLAFAGAEPPAQRHRLPTANRRAQAYGIAASFLILALCFGMGILGYKTAPLWDPPVTASVTGSQPDRLVLHIGESDPERFAATLAYAENYLKQHAGSAMVEVVTNAGGLDLLRPGLSPYDRKVVELMATYRNLHFFACMNSIRNLRRQGVDLELLQNVETGQTAVDHIVNRVVEGWTYVKMDHLPEV